MGKGFADGHSPDEIMLMPADPREWLPPGHLAWKVIELAGVRGTLATGPSARGGMHGGMHDPESEKAARP